MEKEHGEDHGSLGSDAQLMQDKSEFKCRKFGRFWEEQRELGFDKIKKKIYRNKM